MLTLTEKHIRRTKIEKRPFNMLPRSPNTERVTTCIKTPGIISCHTPTMRLRIPLYSTPIRSAVRLNPLPRFSAEPVTQQVDGPDPDFADSLL